VCLCVCRPTSFIPVSFDRDGVGPRVHGLSFELHGKAAKPRRHSPTLVTLSPHPLAALFGGEEDGGVFGRTRSCLHAADSAHNTVHEIDDLRYRDGSIARTMCLVL
jgi:hypothetical protein